MEKNTDKNRTAENLIAEIIASPVFKGITEAEYVQMNRLSCLREKSYRKGEWVFHPGDTTSELGIVLSGSVIVQSTDVWGNTGVLTKAGPGGVFAETYALCRMPLMVEVVVHEDSRILFLDLSVLDPDAPVPSGWQQKLLRNMLDIAIRKNITLSERMFCVSSKTVRSRVLTFLSKQALAAGSKTFQIPFDRQQMADYLNVERTALSKELGKMRDEGLIDFQKNTFTIHQITGSL